MKINSPENCEVVSIAIDRIKHPIAWANRVQSLINSGMSREDAELDVEKFPYIEMELLYDVDNGLFLVESEAIDCVDIFNPYTGEEIEHETTIVNYFSINGYWKDDKSEFNNYIVSDSDSDEVSDSDAEIFFYGLSEDDIKDAIKKGEDTVHDFVITNYIKTN